MRFRPALLALLLSLPAAATAAPTSPLPPRVDKAIRQRIADDEYPALVVALIDHGHSRILTYGKVAGGRPPRADTEFEIGSVTKTFTALLLARAVTQGRLQLDAPLATLLPGFKLPGRDGHAITLANLATQHSGLPRLPGNMHPADVDDPYADYDGAQLKAFLAGYTLAYTPGTHYAYSNLGVGLLGYALARHAGTAYGALLRRRVLQPLGMRHTGVRLDAADRARLARGHSDTGKPTGNWHFAALAGAGGLRSSGADMLRYLRANMGLSHPALQAALALAHTPRTDGPDADERIGLVWMTRHAGTSTVIWHNGMTGGYASFIGFTGNHQRGVVILTNGAVSVDDLGFATLMPGAPLQPAHKRVHLSSKALRAYVGRYRLMPGFLIHVFRLHGQLYARATGQRPFPIFAGGHDRFFATVADISIDFRRDTGGDVDSLVLHQHGDHPAPRLPPRHVVALPAATLAAYTGRYRLQAHAVFRVTLAHGQLMVKLASQPSIPAFASARDHFFLRAADARIDFVRNGQGRVTALILHQNGRDRRAPRLGH